MTHFKIQKLKFFVFLSVFLLSQILTCNGNFREKRQDPNPVPSKKENIVKKIIEEISKNNSKEFSAQKIKTNVSITVVDPKKAGLNITSNETSKSAILGSTSSASNGIHTPSMNAGALMRGFFVIFGLGVIVVVYMVFRSFRLNKTRTQLVRKYGVLAHRQDVEMRPLPLDEDDEDDTTVFDASNIPVHGLQSQHS